MTEPTKACTKCRAVKPLGDFHSHKGTTLGVTSACKVCVNAASKAWREANRERYRQTYREWENRNREKRRGRRQEQERLRVYGITPTEYDFLLATQDEHCAMCPSADRLVVDHCHDTGRVRGLLCHACNVGIGFLRDDPAILRSAIRYLEAN